LEQLIALVKENFSGPVAKTHLERITQFHRIQASPGYREAANYCVREFEKAGVQVELLSFPACEEVFYWTQPGFQEWEVREAWCFVSQPEEVRGKLADFRESPISLIQRSAPFDGEAEVILLEDGEEPEEYEGLDVAGKVVLTKGDIRRVYRLAVAKHGALGILYDGMRETPPIRERLDLPDARQYTSFWWSKGDKKCFGFVLTPRQGEKLRKLLKKGEQVKVKARVESRFYDGAFEVVSALIPGQSDEEVIIVAHLCHPRPSANDNASGAATALEVAATLQRLIEKGELERPKRGIRFLLVPEMTGTYAYLSSHEDRIPRMIAGLNLDMVGQNQELCGSSLLLESPPGAAPSFAPFLLERLREEFLREAKSFSQSGGFPLFRYATTPFSGGSDHYILSDPTVGVPTPMLIQWPDRFYHTDYDTPDKVDPKMLWRVGSMAAAYAYFLANASPDDVIWLGYEMAARLEMRLLEMVREKISRGLRASTGEELASVMDELERAVEHWQWVAERTADSLKKLWPGGDDLVLDLRAEIDCMARQQLQKAREILGRRALTLGLNGIPPAPPKKLSDEEKEAASLTPRRLHRGPPAMLEYHVKKLPEEEQEEWHRLRKEHKQDWYLVSAVAVYWADGTRSLLDIARLVELETGLLKLDFLLKYFSFLEKMGLVKLERR